MVLVDNHWKINESEKVGTVIARVQASDADPNDVLTFGLDFDELTRKENETLPFRINQDTGVVYLNESLDGRGGEQFLLYVTVTDGTYNAKNGVMVNVLPKNSKVNNGNGLPPFRQPFKNATHLLPPFGSLPGVPPRPIYPPLYPTRPPPYNPPAAAAESDSDVGDIAGANNSSDQPLSPPPHKSNGSTKPNKNGTTTAGTNEMPFNVDDSDDGDTTASNETNIADGKRIHSTNSTSETTTFPNSSLKTVLPIAIIACGIIIASGLIVSSFLFRKRLCAIGKSLKNKSKEEMAKKSNQSNLSCSTNTVMMSSLSEDSRNSMVMQHWNGPTAFSNRYVPWERENPHMQVNTIIVYIF